MTFEKRVPESSIEGSVVDLPDQLRNLSKLWQVGHEIWGKRQGASLDPRDGVMSRCVEPIVRELSVECRHGCVQRLSGVR